MEKLRLYTIDTDYIEYLYSFDNNIMFWSAEHYKKNRKYIGVVLKINEFDYFAPLSSPKETDYYYKNGVKNIRKSTIPIIRLITPKGNLLGKIKLGSMIPVQNEYVSLYNIEQETDLKYRDLIAEELICIRKCKKEIQKNARILYNQKIHNYPNIKYLDNVVDFGKLEKASSNFKKS